MNTKKHEDTYIEKEKEDNNICKKELVNDLRQSMDQILNKYFNTPDDVVEDEEDNEEQVIEFAQRLSLLENKGQIFRHFKGDSYILIDIAEDTETGEELVIYKALYGKCKLYARPIKMFLEEVPKDKPNPTGQKYRFEYVEYESIKE